LQAVQLDLLEVQTHICEILSVIRQHRDDATSAFKELFEQAQTVADKVDVAITAPR